MATFLEVTIQNGKGTRDCTDKRFACQERFSVFARQSRNATFRKSCGVMSVHGPSSAWDGIGLLAELVTRTYYESQGKSIYTVREELGHAGEGNRDE